MHLNRAENKRIIKIAEDIIVKQCLICMHAYKGNKSRINKSIKSTNWWLNDDMSFQISRSIIKDINIEKIKIKIDEGQKEYNDNYGASIPSVLDLSIIKRQVDEKFYLFEKLDYLQEIIKLEKNIKNIISFKNNSRNKL